VIETRSGGYAEFCTISASLVARIDDRLDASLAVAVPGLFQATLARLYAMVASGSPTPIVGLELPLEKAAEAHAAMEARTTIGKIVLTVEKKRTTMKKEPR